MWQQDDCRHESSGDRTDAAGKLPTNKEVALREREWLSKKN